MFNDFLGSLLKVVVVLDIVGLVAYFAMGLVRPGRRLPAAAAVAETAPPMARPVATGAHGGGLRRYLGSRLRGRHAAPGAPLSAALGNLRRVLLSYEESLA